MKLVALAVVLCACGRVNFDTSADAVGGGGDGPAAIWPNRPSDCTVHTDTTMEIVPQPGWGSVGGATSVADPTAPSGAGAVTQFRFPIGAPPGSSAGNLYFDGIPASARELYAGIYWKPSNPWDPAENGNNNILYIIQDDSGTLVNHVLSMRNINPPFQIATSYRLVTYGDNISNVVVRLGEWHLLEVHRRASTTDTSADGLIEFFVNGTLRGQATNVSFVQVPIISVNIQPNWGGGTGPNKVSEDFYWFDRATVCTR